MAFNCNLDPESHRLLNELKPYVARRLGLLNLSTPAFLRVVLQMVRDMRDAEEGAPSGPAQGSPGGDRRSPLGPSGPLGSHPAPKTGAAENAENPGTTKPTVGPLWGHLQARGGGGWPVTMPPTE